MFLIDKNSNFFNFDIIEKSLILYPRKSIALIFLFFSKNKILEILVFQSNNFSNFSSFDINE